MGSRPRCPPAPGAGTSQVPTRARPGGRPPRCRRACEPPRCADAVEDPASDPNPGSSSLRRRRRRAATAGPRTVRYSAIPRASRCQPDCTLGRSENTAHSRGLTGSPCPPSHGQTRNQCLQTKGLGLSNRLTVDLGDVEPRARLQQAIEVEEGIALALELDVGSIVGEDARANPLLKLAGQKYNGAKLVGSPNQSKAYDRTSHHRRWYSEPFDMLGRQRSFDD